MVLRALVSEVLGGGWHGHPPQMVACGVGPVDRAVASTGGPV